jgi:N-acetylated-alpha-linked acidic dipeptidase
MTTKPVVSLVLAAALLAAQSPAPPLAGFNATSSLKQFELEKQFDATLSRQNMDRWLKDFSSRPHHLGSPGGKIVAEKIAALLKSWGYETEIETFYPLFPTPKTRFLEMISPERYTARLAEPPVEGDATSTQTDGLPVYNAYSRDGDVTGQLVYVNYGVPADYERLEKMGIDVKGKIVIARYFGSWRGIKPKVAAEHGAIGCLIYSDPKEDGYFNGDTYPKGGYRSPFSAQRGSVLDMPVYPGDPLTPGVGATKDAKRLAQKDAQTITKIPVLPISYGDAEPLLRALGGPVAPVEWRGALPITYHVGPGTATVHLKLEFDWKLTPAYDVIARMKGAERPGEWIIRGNPHDAWVFGATDPLSGTVEMLEEARGIAELTKQGWRPKRTIVFCAWDGEEPALLGSTEWAEQHAAELQQHAAVYINTDSTSRGFVELGGSHSLELFATQAARDVVDPAYKVSALERKQASQYAKTGTKPAEFAIEPLGSGSDFTPFLQHLGIATLNFGFGGEEAYGVYHSNYDSYDHHVKFEDPDLQYATTTAQLGGRMILRMANADVLPLRFENLSKTVAGYVKELTKLADDEREQTVSYNALAASGALRLAGDPRKTSVAAPAKQPVPFINFAPLQNAMAKLQLSVDAWAKVDISNLEPARASALDAILIKAEQSLLDERGLPSRPWFKHMLYAPGLYTGYGVKTLPGIREAIEQRNWPEADIQIGHVSSAVIALAAQIDRATAAAK